MGGSSKKQTVGYKYFLGMHMALCHGPVDALTRIRVDGRTAWEGTTPGGRITIVRPDLFGGEKREGGISGSLDFAPGGPTQTANDYIAAQLGGSVPAFRGVACAILRHMYLGMNPYLKRWSFRVQRIHTRQDGKLQWYDPKAAIGPVVKWTQPQAIYIAVDLSSSMSEGGRLESMKAAVIETLNCIDAVRIRSGVRVDIKVLGWSAHFQPRPSMQIFDAGSADIVTLQTFVGGLDWFGNTDFREAVAEVADFFSAAHAEAERTVLFITDGEPYLSEWGSEPPPDAEAQKLASVEEAAATLFAVAGVRSYAFNIDLSNTFYTAMMDNTPKDGVPIVDGGDPTQLMAALGTVCAEQRDMNPAHIIREAITDPDWGMGYAEEDVDDGRFRAAADTLYDEAMGISIQWNREQPIEDFIKEILRHIDAVLFVDRTTGKFALKLIRDDYDEESLLSLGPGDIERIEEFARPSFDELVNSVTVTYTDGNTGKTAAVTSQDIALAQMQGGVIGETIHYPGFTDPEIAARVAARDLKALSIPLASCTIYANRKAASLAIGEPFKLVWPDYFDGYLVMRVTQMAHGDGASNLVRITCLQDVFALPEQAIVTSPDEARTDPSVPPLPASYRVVAEAPYYELVQWLGQSSADRRLTDNPFAGFLVASAQNPGGAINMELVVDSGAGYEEIGAVDFCPCVFLASAIGYTDTVIPITGTIDPEDVRIGSHAQVDGEIVRVDAIGSAEITVGRGCLDTVPAKHDPGAAVFFWDDYARGDEVEYAAGETLDVKLLPSAGGGIVALDDAVADSVMMDQRALRPYPPGKLSVAGFLMPEAITYATALSLTWAHRDRTQQTSGVIEDTTAANIGPEVGVTYNLRIYGESDNLLRNVTGIAGTSYDYPYFEELSESGLGAAPAPPDSISGLLRWYKAESITGLNDGDPIQTWPDSSAAADHATQSNLGNRPIYKTGIIAGYPVARFLGGQFLNFAQIFNSAAATGHVFIVEKSDYRSDSGAWLSNRPNMTANGWTWRRNDGDTAWYFHLNGPPVHDLSTLADDVWQVMELQRNGLTINQGVGGLMGSWVTLSSYTVSTNAGTMIGAESGGVGSLLIGDIAEIIIYDRLLSPTERQAVLAYLDVKYFAGTAGGGPRVNGRVRIELEAVRDALLSYQKHNYVVLREGYGLNYGYLYGGM